jgi:hypothetical protein
MDEEQASPDPTIKFGLIAAGIVLLILIGGFILAAVLLSGPSSGAPVPQRQQPAQGAVKVAVSDFVDNAASFKGKTVTLATRVSSGSRELRFYVGGSTFLELEGSEYKLSFDIPAGLDIPNAAPRDKLFVTFRCDRGERHRGNVAVKIEHRYAAR